MPAKSKVENGKNLPSCQACCCRAVGGEAWLSIHAELRYSQKSKNAFHGRCSGSRSLAMILAWRAVSWPLMSTRLMPPLEVSLMQTSLLGNKAAAPAVSGLFAATKV